MSDPESPAGPERAPSLGAARYKQHPSRERKQRQRPEIQRRKTGCRHGAECQGEELRPAVGESDDAGRCLGHARSLAARTWRDNDLPFGTTGPLAAFDGRGPVAIIIPDQVRDDKERLCGAIFSYWVSGWGSDSVRVLPYQTLRQPVAQSTERKKPTNPLGTRAFLWLRE